MRILEQGTVLFSRYKITDVIGSGGSGKVYLAENVKVGTLVAIKSVPRDRSAADLIGEKELLKELRHSAIPIILDIEEDEDNLYLVEEYVEGKVLADLRQQLKEKELMAIMTQICDVLHYLHTIPEVPVIYRDMKPENVILMADGHIKLIDFGIAVKYSDDPSSQKAHYGTRGYAAPEQLSYSRSDEKTDIFALGVTIYYMLTGKNLSHPPYRLKPIREVNPEITAEFAAIISKCIETLPGKRYQTVAQIIHDLKAFGLEDKSELDFRAFKERSNRTVTVTGVRRGIGTTHTAFMLAAYFKASNQSVALIEWQKRDDLLKLASYYPEIEEERYRYRFEGMDCYFHVSGSDYEKCLADKYDVILIDAGSYDEMLCKGSYEMSDDLLVICGSKDWDLDYFEDMVYSDMAGQARYLFNFTEESTYKRIKKEFPGSGSLLMPYNPNPYTLSEAAEVLIAKILCDEAPFIQAEGKGVLSRVKTSVQKQLKNLAKG